MAIDWKTIISEFDGKPTLLQAIGKLRKAVEEETMAIQQAQAEIAKLESQQKVDEALINTKQDKLNDKTDVSVAWLTASGVNAGTVKAGEVSDDEDNMYNFPKKSGTFALAEDVTAVDTKAQNALDLATTNETDIGTLDGQVAELEQNKVDKIKGQSEYVMLYGVSAQGQQTTYEGTELNVPWKFVRRDANGNIQISSSKKSSDAINRGEFDAALATKQKILSAEKSFVFNGKEVKAPSFYGGEMLVSNGIKTLFGNQSIYGKGNIDLYYHYVAVTINNVRYPLHIDFYSSKSLKCDSLTDLKTLLGDTFERALFGSATTGADGAFFGNFLSNSGAHGIIVGSSTVSAKYYEWADITINDIVTTI